jgi:hypothetical protein
MAAGRPIRFINVSPEEMKYALSGIGFPAWQADGLIEDYDFKSFARDYARFFS